MGVNASSIELLQLLDDATDTLSKFVVPLYVDERGRPKQIGSGFFVRAGSATFLVSAAHVLELGTALYYYIEPRVTARLSGDRRLNKWIGDRERDPVDVGTLKLTGPAPPFKAIDKLAVDFAYLRPGLLPRSDKIYSIIGFPGSRGSKVNTSTREIVTVVHAYRNRSIPDGEYSKHGVSPRSHVVLPMDLRTGVDSSGAQRTFPKPQGMSGSPIWMLLEEGPVAGERSFPIVAVGTKYRKSARILIGTDIDIVTHMIREAV